MTHGSSSGFGALESGNRRYFLSGKREKVTRAPQEDESSSPDDPLKSKSIAAEAAPAVAGAETPMKK
jgi:hypothetical protein